MNSLRAICFDIGDTLVFDDPPIQERVRRALDSLCLSYDATMMPAAFRTAEDHALEQYLHGVPLDDPMLLKESANLILKKLDLNSESAPVDQLSEAYATIRYTRSLHPQTLALIAELKGRGFLIGVISDWEETLPALLNELMLAPQLDALAISAQVGVTKPNRKLFDAALGQLGLPGQKVMHVGDYFELDVAGAREAGMIPLFFDWKQRRLEADCARVIAFDEMADFLLALPAPVAI